MRVIVLLTLLAACLAAPARGQGTRADYERSATVGDRLRDTVFRDRVEPHWEPGGTRFWYRVRTGPGAAEFVRIDAEAGTRKPAFDHNRVSACTV